MRGIFSCGILDSFLQHDYRPFDLCIGVSAGANNLSGYLAGMYQRNYRIYTDYSLRRRFINKWRFFRGGDVLDLDWLWEITIREMPLDLTAVQQHPAAYLVGVTRADTGQIEYLEPEQTPLADLLKASSAVPLFYRKPVRLHGTPYVDGGIAEPIPVHEAVARGAERILVLRSRPASYRMDTRARHRLSAAVLRNHPRLVETIRRRASHYNETVEYLRNPPAGITIQEINPPEDFALGRLTTDRRLLEHSYQYGREIGDRIAAGG